MPNDHTCIATPIIGGPSEPMLSCSGTSGPCKCQSLVEVPKSSLLQKTRQRLVVDAQGIYIYTFIIHTHIYIYTHQFVQGICPSTSRFRLGEAGPSSLHRRAEPGGCQKGAQSCGASWVSGLYTRGHCCGKGMNDNIL